MIPQVTASETETNRLIVFTVADAYVVWTDPDLGYDDDNFGDDLTIETVNLPDAKVISYIKFDLRDLPDDLIIRSIKLKLRVKHIRVSSYVTVHYCEDSGWNECEITWNNKPSYSSTAIDGEYVSNIDRYYTWDVTNKVKKFVGKGVVTLVIKTETDDGDVVFYSKEESYLYSPQLIISYVVYNWNVRLLDGDGEALPDVEVEISLVDKTPWRLLWVVENGVIKVSYYHPESMLFRVYLWKIKVLETTLTLTDERQEYTVKCRVYDLIVHVVDEEGKGLSNAKVTLSWPNGTKIFSRLTNNTGFVVFENLPSTNYLIKTSLGGYRDQTLEVTLTSEDQMEIITLQLIPFIETPLGIATISIGVIATIIVLIILRRKMRVSKLGETVGQRSIGMHKYSEIASPPWNRNKRLRTRF